jgi:hypothetical protein
MRFGLLPAATLALFLCAALIGPRAGADIAFIGANADVSEHFAFVALNSYAPGTVLNFTDSGYGTNDPGLATKFRWTEHFVSGGPLSLTLSTTLTLGQVVIFDAADGRFERPGGAAYGTTSGAAMLFGSTSVPADNIFAYRGTVTEDAATTEAYRGDTSGVTSFEGALAWGRDGVNGPWQTSGGGDAVGSYLPATPNTPFNFADVTTLDNVRYNGSRTFTSVAALKAALTNASNWTGSDTTVTSPAGFGGDFVVAVPEASAVGFFAVAGLGVLARRLWRRRRYVTPRSAEGSGV